MRRWPPAELSRHQHRQRAPLLMRTAPFFVSDTTTHDCRSQAPTTTSSRPSASSRQRRRDRERLGQFVAEGEDLLAAADAAGWEPVERFCATGSGLPGTEVDAAAAGRRHRAGVRHPHARDLQGALAGGPARPPLRLPARGPRPRQRRHGAALRRRVRCRLRCARAGQRRPVQPEGGAREHGRDLHGAGRRTPASRELPGVDGRARRRRRRPLADVWQPTSRPRAEVTRAGRRRTRRASRTTLLAAADHVARSRSRPSR